MEADMASLGSVLFLFGIVSAKWALELGYSQMSQIAHFLGGLFLGPLVLMILYIRIIYKKKSEGSPGSQFFGSSNS